VKYPVRRPFLRNWKLRGLVPKSSHDMSREIDD
jgi:hypothetical protein